MKIKNILSFVLVSVLGLISCSKDNVNSDMGGGQEETKFKKLASVNIGAAEGNKEEMPESRTAGSINDAGKPTKIYYENFVNLLSLDVTDNISENNINECINYAGLVEEKWNLDRMVTNMLDESGLVPSGGQTQKIILSRVVFKFLFRGAKLLILDEPINGLDPAGIVEIRNLLKSLNKEYGMTILVSSHILEELYQTASEFILIDKGKIIEEISDRELNDRCKRHIAIKATDPQKALIVLEETLHTDSFKLMPDGMIRLYDYLDDMEKVAAALSDAHILVTGLSVAGDTLEDYFLSKIGGTGNVKSPKS